MVKRYRVEVTVSVRRERLVELGITSNGDYFSKVVATVATNAMVLPGDIGSKITDWFNQQLGAFVKLTVDRLEGREDAVIDWGDLDPPL